MLSTGILFHRELGYRYFNVIASKELCVQKYIVVDSDPHRSSLIWLSWIRICIGNVNPDPGARKLTKILIYKETSFPIRHKGFCRYRTYVGMFYDLLHCLNLSEGKSLTRIQTSMDPH
jgi:hypothetical protein